MNLCHKFVSEVNFGYGASNALVASTRGHSVVPGQLSTLVHSMKYIYVIFYFKFLLGELFAMRKKHTLKCGRYVIKKIIINNKKYRVISPLAYLLHRKTRIIEYGSSLLWF